MLIGIGASIYSGNRYDAAISSASLAARFDAALGITSSGGFASAWADLSGNGRSLLQATGANQPIHLPFVGVKYGWLPGVAGNYFSTPDSAAASITGDIDIRVKVALADWTPAASNVLLAKDNGAAQRSYILYMRTDGKLQFTYTSDGSSVVGRDATSSAATGIADSATSWVRVTLATATGKVNFYTSSDGISWAVLGVEQSTTPSNIFDGTAMVELGSYASGVFPISGRIYSAQIYNGIDGTLAVDFDPSRWTSGTTFTAATGETWTINSTGSKPAQIVDRPSLLFDGAAHYMKCNAFTLNQPETVYLVAKQVSWTVQDYLYDGEATNTMILYQSATTPNIRMYAGATGNENSGLAVGSRGVIASVFNGASSSSQVNAGSVVTMDVGASNAGGFTMGSTGAGTSNFSNLQAYEALIYNVAHDAATRANIIRALMSKHGVA